MSKQENETEKHHFLGSDKSWRELSDPYKIKVINREYILKYLAPPGLKYVSGKRRKIENNI